MFTITKTTSQNPKFLQLVSELDKQLAIRNGSAHEFFAQFNKVDAIQHVIVAMDDTVAVGCGAIKVWDNKTMEVKRRYVIPDARGLGISKQIITTLEQWAKELGYSRCILETKSDMVPAIKLYEKCGYQRIPNYDQYIDVSSSVCFQKKV